MNANNPDEIKPTRRLNAKERVVFDRIVSDFNHLASSDAEQITQYAEAVVRYQTAAKETKKNPTVSLPVINRTTGNVTGQKIVRSPAFLTLKEAQTAMNSLGRRLMIDAHSAEKRRRLVSKRLRSDAVVPELDAVPRSASADTALDPDDEFDAQFLRDLDRVAAFLKRYEGLPHVTVGPWPPRF